MTLELPSWAWLVPVVMLSVLRPRILFVLLRTAFALLGALILAVFAVTCL